MIQNEVNLNSCLPSVCIPGVFLPKSQFLGVLGFNSFLEIELWQQLLLYDSHFTEKKIILGKSSLTMLNLSSNLAYPCLGHAHF